MNLAIISLFIPETNFYRIYKGIVKNFWYFTIIIFHVIDILTKYNLFKPQNIF